MWEGWVDAGGMVHVEGEGPTQAEIMRVRRYECRTSGHSYSHVHAMFVDGPVKIICDNCGKSWNVENPDA